MLTLFHPLNNYLVKGFLYRTTNWKWKMKLNKTMIIGVFLSMALAVGYSFADELMSSEQEIVGNDGRGYPLPPIINEDWFDWLIG